MHTQQAQGRAALAGAAEGALHHRVAHLLGQRGAVNQHGVDATGLGNQRHDGTVFGGQRPVDALGHGGGAGEHHPGHAGCGHQRGAHRVACAVQQLQRTFRHTGAVQQLDGFQRHARGLLGRFGQHGVASGQSGGHLAHEDGQRKVPRADADPGAAGGQAQCIALTGHAQQGVALHARQGLRRHDALGLPGVVAQKVDGFAHLAHRISPGFKGFFDQQGAKARQLGLQRGGRLAQHVSAFTDRCFTPFFVAA